MTFNGIELSYTLWGVFALSFVVFSVTSVFLLYHWRKYEISTSRAVTFTLSYFVVSALLLITALGSLIAYLN